MKEYPTYQKVCAEAVVNNNTFANFRREKDYHKVVEGIPIDLGEQYAIYIAINYPYLLPSIETFITSDTVGNPIMYYYKGVNKLISPVTCRYIKVLGDLHTYFGDLSEMDIVEVGVGFGGLCKIIHDYAKPKSYTIVDLPEAGELAKKYLGCFGITDVKFKTPDSEFTEEYDLCISNYAFSEFDREYQELYAEKIIKKSKKGYMICNFFGKYTIAERTNGFTEKEILDLKLTGEIYSEKPMSAEGNFLYIW